MQDIKQLIERLRASKEWSIRHEAADALERLTQPVGVEPLKLADSQWMNIVNHDHAYESYDKEEAVHLAVKLTEQKMAELHAETVARLQVDLDVSNRMRAAGNKVIVAQEETIKKLQAERDELSRLLRLVLPLAKGYAYTHPVGQNAVYCTEADEALAKIEGSKS